MTTKAPNSIESEFEDVALGAAPAARSLRRLVLYEPSPGIQAAPPELLAEMEDLLARGDREGVVETVMRDFAGLDDEAFAAFRASELWEPRVAAAHTVPRETRARRT